MIGNLSLSSASINRWSWSKDASGIYKVSTLSNIIQSISLAQCRLDVHHKWNSWIPRKDRVDNIKQEDIFPSIQRITKIWIFARASSRPANWNCWITRSFDLFGAV
ncbi:hypothetical protein Tco_1059946 [Tanacetum coccineum]